MSGGAFDYKQFSIKMIQEELQEEIEKQGKPKDTKELWANREYYEKYPEEKNYPIYDSDIEEIFICGVYALKKAYIYAQRIDWFLSGDDGEDQFKERLKEELETAKEGFIIDMIAKELEIHPEPIRDKGAMVDISIEEIINIVKKVNSKFN